MPNAKYLDYRMAADMAFGPITLKVARCVGDSTYDEIEIRGYGAAIVGKLAAEVMRFHCLVEESFARKGNLGQFMADKGDGPPAHDPSFGDVVRFELLSARSDRLGLLGTEHPVHRFMVEVARDQHRDPVAEFVTMFGKPDEEEPKLSLGLL
jgi:hypothetical protein